MIGEYEAQDPAPVVQQQPQEPEQVQVQVQSVHKLTNFAYRELELATKLTYLCLCVFCFGPVLCTAIAWNLALAVS